MRRLERPLVGLEAVGWAGVDDRLERVAHDRLGEAWRRVIRARCRSPETGGHVYGAFAEHNWQAVRVVPYEPEEWHDPPDELVVAFAGSAQSADTARVRLGVERLAQRRHAT